MDKLFLSLLIVLLCAFPAMAEEIPDAETVIFNADTANRNYEVGRVSILIKWINDAIHDHPYSTAFSIIVDKEDADFFVKDLADPYTKKGWFYSIKPDKYSDHYWINISTEPEYI